MRSQYSFAPTIFYILNPVTVMLAINLDDELASLKCEVHDKCLFCVNMKCLLFCKPQWSLRVTEPTD